MRRATRALVPLLFLALGLPLAGCNVASVKLQIPGFESAQVEGVTFWREVDGQFVVDGHLLFEEIVVEDGVEVVRYRVQSATGAVLLQSSAPVVRDSVDPDDVRLEVYYARLAEEPALFKVSTFNAVGESPLTEESRVI